jgi:hypothetical protein
MRSGGKEVNIYASHASHRLPCAGWRSSWKEMGKEFKDRNLFSRFHVGWQELREVIAESELKVTFQVVQ